MKYILILFIIISISCQKEGKRAGLPQINVVSPTMGATFEPGDTIPISLHFNHEDDLHDWQFDLRLGSTDSVLMVRKGHEHAKQVYVNAFFIHNLGGILDSIKLNISVQDHLANKTTISSIIYLQP